VGKYKNDDFCILKKDRNARFIYLASQVIIAGNNSGIF
jgi:hypothetical protein